MCGNCPFLETVSLVDTCPEKVVMVGAALVAVVVIVILVRLIDFIFIFFNSWKVRDLAAKEGAKVVVVSAQVYKEFF